MATSKKKIKANQRNGRKSKGPTTPAGKEVSRRNSLKHGLTANPASGVVEEPSVFEALQDELVRIFSPRNSIEQILVNQIAVALWRKQRAVICDTALSQVAVTTAQNRDERVRHWIDKINGHYWEVQVAPERDRKLLKKYRESGRLGPNAKLERRQRPWLHDLDSLREVQMMHEGAAITAMLLQLEELAELFDETPNAITYYEAQLMAWLLGESAGRLAVKTDDLCGDDGLYFPDNTNRATATDKAIGDARKREPGTPMPCALAALIQRRKSALLTLRKSCEMPWTDDQHESQCRAALLPDANVLDRIIRYENHADRSLHRELNALAKLRGTTVDRLMSDTSVGQKDSPVLKLDGRPALIESSSTGS